MADSDSSKNKMADETEVASSESDMECGKVFGTTESGDRPPSVGVSADDKMEYEASAIEKTAKPEEAVKSATTSKSDVATDGMECGGNHDEPKCVGISSEIREESKETAETVRTNSECKDEMACEDAAGKLQWQYSERSLKESGLSTGSEEESEGTSSDLSTTRGLDDREPDSGDLGDESSHSDSFFSSSSARTRAKDAKSKTTKAGVLKQAKLSYLPTSFAKSSKEKDMEIEVSESPKTLNKDSQQDSFFIRTHNTKPEDLESHGTVIDVPNPDLPKHVELVVMKEADEAELGELSSEEMSATSAIIGLPSVQHSHVELPMEQDESAAMSESMQSDAEMPCSHDGGKRRMESSDEGQSECTSPSKKRNIKR